MKEIILIKYGEIILKGLNRRWFENLLIKNIRSAIGSKNVTSIVKGQAVIYITPNPDADIDVMVERLSKVFGIVFIARAAVFPKDMDVILNEGADYLEDALAFCNTFKVEARRSD